LNYTTLFLTTAVTSKKELKLRSLKKIGAFIFKHLLKKICKQQAPEIKMLFLNIFYKYYKS